MMRTIPAVLQRTALGLLLLLTMTARAVQVTDDRGLTVVLSKPPQRIVSLLPSLTESVCMLGACERLVGVDRYSNYPERVSRLPKVGGGIDPDLEAIVALRPDVVLLATSSRATARLQALGVRVVALEPRTHADVRRTLDVLGHLLGPPATTEASRVWHRIEVDMARATAALPTPLHGVRVYFEVNDGPYAAGPSSFIGETLSQLGVGNIVPAGLGPFPPLNPEFVVRADPDVIMVGDSRLDAMVRRPGWARLRAVRTGHVCAFSQAQADVLVRAGPRMAEGAQLMADCLRRLGGPR